MVLGGNHKHNNINLLLASKDSSGLEAITVEAGGVNKRDINNAIVEERLGGRARVGKVQLNHLLCLPNNPLQISNGSSGIRRLVLHIVYNPLFEDVHLLPALV